MPDTPKALICVLETDEQWARLCAFFRESDVEAGGDPVNAYDLRDDRIFYWGRDGWRKGFYHAVLYRVESADGWNFLAEANDDKRAADVLRIARTVASHIQPILESSTDDE